MITPVRFRAFFFVFLGDLPLRLDRRGRPPVARRSAISQPIPPPGGNDIPPWDASGLAHAGEHVYAANGCVYCHTQQVRPASSGADIIRGWGTAKNEDATTSPPRSRAAPIPRDYIWQGQVFLGNNRDGADLSNVADRFPDAASLYRYLYDPSMSRSAQQHARLPLPLRHAPRSAAAPPTTPSSSPAATAPPPATRSCPPPRPRRSSPTCSPSRKATTCPTSTPARSKCPPRRTRHERPDVPTNHAPAKFLAARPRPAPRRLRLRRAARTQRHPARARNAARLALRRLRLRPLPRRQLLRRPRLRPRLLRPGHGRRRHARKPRGPAAAPRR